MSPGHRNRYKDSATESYNLPQYNTGPACCCFRETVIVGAPVGVTAFPALLKLRREETEHSRETEAKQRKGTG